MADEVVPKKETPAKTVAPEFAKEQFQGSEQFTQIEKDTLNVLLEDGRNYSISEAKRILAEWLKKEVK
ncbi:hypothetical protein ACIFQM_00955 [Paenibacillus sp. NRS-1782]|uniref:hypothetical protein n=1 Tax=unclassified Paenibacillus TaxID=185978 RepID=UPI003D27E9F6